MNSEYAAVGIKNQDKLLALPLNLTCFLLPPRLLEDLSSRKLLKPLISFTWSVLHWDVGIKNTYSKWPLCPTPNQKDKKKRFWHSSWVEPYGTQAVQIQNTPVSCYKRPRALPFFIFNTSPSHSIVWINPKAVNLTWSKAPSGRWQK